MTIDTPSSSSGPGMEEPRHAFGSAPVTPGGTRGLAPGLSSQAQASQPGETLGGAVLDTAEQQKRAGADFMSSVADAVRRAAREFDQPAPQAARYIRYAADQMDQMSDAVRRRDLGQMVSGVQSFARRQPTAFLGASFLAGFAAMRFLRSTAGSAASPAAPDGAGAPEDNGRHGAAPGPRSGGPGSGM